MSAEEQFDLDDLDDPIPFPRPDEGVEREPFWDETSCAWVVAVYSEVDRVLRDAESFSSSSTLGPAREKAFAEMTARIGEDPRADYVSTFFKRTGGHSDGRAHKRKRSFFGRAFTPNRVRGFEPMIESICDELLPPILGREDVPFVSEFAAPLTVQIIAQALGLPREDWPTLMRWSESFEGLTTPDPTPERIDAFLTFASEFTAYVIPIVEERRRTPENDIVTALIGANADGEVLDDQEILSMLNGLLVAGNGTTSAALAGIMMYLARQPELQERVRGDLALVPALVEEGLRLTSPFQAFFRTAVTASEVGGSRVADGDNVFLHVGAANRDPDQFEQPRCPRLDRPDTAHLAFGRGPHACPGAPLARAELHVALRALLLRTKEIRLSDRAEPVVAGGSAMTTRVGEIYLDLHT